MKSLKLIVGTGLLVASVAVFAQTPGTGIKGTAHDWTKSQAKLLLWDDLKGTGGSTDNRYGTPLMDPVSGKQMTKSVDIGLCTKCHTPHQAKSTNLLWNHTLSTATYSWDDPKTTAGTNYATMKGDTYRGPTTKCLSCHDGVLSSTDGMWFNRQMTSAAKYVAAPGTIDSGHEVAKGNNMSGTHPVAMPYPINGASNTYNGTTNGVMEVSEWVADPMGTNKIRLFTDDGTGKIHAGVTVGKTGMECSSCHDVHNGARAVDVMLLTGKLAGNVTAPGGYICQQCHQK